MIISLSSHFASRPISKLPATSASPHDRAPHLCLRVTGNKTYTPLYYNSFTYLPSAYSSSAMAAHIPEKLKAADLTRFVLRASQLETVKPVIAYWCKLSLSQIVQELTPAGEYWIVNQILSRGLHNGDNETLQYTTTLMDKLEQVSDILTVYRGRR
jgi:hypothetical protein